MKEALVGTLREAEWGNSLRLQVGGGSLPKGLRHKPCGALGRAGRPVKQERPKSGKKGGGRAG